jgi:hypothetical protein
VPVRTVKDPQAAKPIQLVDPTTKTKIPGNIIPASQLVALGRALASYFPAPTLATAPGAAIASNYNFNGTRETINEHSIKKVDHTFSERDSLFVK